MVETQQFDGHSRNGWLVLGYEAIDDLVFTGILDGQDKWHVSRILPVGTQVLGTLDEEISTGTPYVVQAIARGTDLTL